MNQFVSNGTLYIHDTRKKLKSLQKWSNNSAEICVAVIKYSECLMQVLGNNIFYYTCNTFIIQYIITEFVVLMDYKLLKCNTFLKEKSSRETQSPQKQPGHVLAPLNQGQSLSKIATKYKVNIHSRNQMGCLEFLPRIHDRFFQ